jgi:predicted transcriptional regulator
MRQLLTKQESGFVQIKNSVISELPCELLGLYVYIYSKPDDWDFSAYRIADDLKMHRNTCEKYIRQLEELGYIQRERLATGKMNYYINYDRKPMHKNSTVVKTHSDRIVPISNKENKQIKKDNKYISSSEDEIVFNYEDYLNTMKEDSNKAIQLIRVFFMEKKLKFKTKKEVQFAITRNIKEANTLMKTFEIDDVIEAIEFVKDKYPNIWTLETLSKYLINHRITK